MFSVKLISALAPLLAVNQLVYAHTEITAKLTHYGAKDNCPPGPAIAWPKIHQSAGGSGTHADPITYAGATAATPKGSIIYVPKYKKYFVMEDQCEECEKDWKNK